MHMGCQYHQEKIRFNKHTLPKTITYSLQKIGLGSPKNGELRLSNHQLSGTKVWVSGNLTTFSPPRPWWTQNLRKRGGVLLLGDGAVGRNGSCRVLNVSTQLRWNGRLQARKNERRKVHPQNHLHLKQKNHLKQTSIDYCVPCELSPGFRTKAPKSPPENKDQS